MQWLNRSIAILLSSWVYGSTWKWIAGAFEMLPTKIFFSNLVQIQMLIYRCSHTRIQTRIYEYTRTTLTLWTTSKDLSRRQIIISVKLPYPNSYQNKKLYCTYYYLFKHVVYEVTQPARPHPHIVPHQVHLLRAACAV